MNEALPSRSNSEPIPSPQTISDMVQAAMLRAGISEVTSPVSELVETNTTAEVAPMQVATVQAELPTVVATNLPTVSAPKAKFSLPQIPQLPKLPAIPELSPVVYGVAATVFLCVALAVGLVVLEPPRLSDAFDVFNTPLHVIPEWYMLPAFGVVLAAPTKLVGLGLMSGVLLILFSLPLLPKLEKFVPGGLWIFRALFVFLHVGVAVLGLVSMRA